MRMLRNWGGIVDVTPDRSPIIGKTPVPGLFVNCGWGTGGFKATPGSGHVFAHTIARGEPHPYRRAVHARPLPHRAPDRRSRRRGGRPLKVATMLLIPCPYCGMERPELEFRNGGEAHVARPADPSATSDEDWANYLYIRDNSKGVYAERWRHAAGCGRFFNCLRDTYTRQDHRDLQGRRGEARSRRRRRGGAPMSQAFRVADRGGVDRARPLNFTFDGVAYHGYAGDTLASALLANGVHLVGRSYKYHRPRGILSAGPEEPNALVGVAAGTNRFTPNLRATQVELSDGLAATSQNRWPSLGFDVGEINNLLSPFFGAGFYYKTFMGPAFLGKTWAWKNLYEPFIRRAAGLGDAPSAPDPDRYARYFDHCDVLVVGGGPAGLSAALAAGRSGADVVLCDDGVELGGSLLAETRASIDGLSARGWLEQTARELAGLPNVRVMTRTQAFGYYAQNFVALSERVAPGAGADQPRERLWQLRAREVVLAAGAIERPLVFADNDRPGVMLAESARRYLNAYGVKVGARAAVATAHDSAYRAALDLKEAGVEIALIADLREKADGPLPEAARRAGLNVVTGASVARRRRAAQGERRAHRRRRRGNAQRRL